MVKHFYFIFCLKLFTLILFATIPDVCSQSKCLLFSGNFKNVTSINFFKNLLVKSQNWIAVNSDWPADDNSKLEPFYFFHADENQATGRSFDFSRTFFSTLSSGDLVKAPYLKFKVSF